MQDDNPPTSDPCPACGSPILDNAVICTSCGFDRRTGRQHCSEDTHTRSASNTTDGRTKTIIYLGKIVRVGLIIVMIAMIVFPPWCYKDEESLRHMGYAPIWEIWSKKKPMLFRWLKWQGGISSLPIQDRIRLESRLNFECRRSGIDGCRLTLQLVIIVVLGACLKYKLICTSWSDLWRRIRWGPHPDQRL